MWDRIVEKNASNASINVSFVGQGQHDGNDEGGREDTVREQGRAR
jgi:hypothetical protein